MITATANNSLDRYVSTTGKDSNPGSAELPWATLQHAAYSARPGMTIHVAPGTYRMTAVIVSTARGTETSRIRFLSDQQWGAKLISSANTIWTNGGAYVDIVGFDMSGSATTYTGIHSQGQFDRTVGNRVHDFGSEGCISGAGIVIGGGAAHQSAIANITYNIGPLPPAVPGCNQIHGIYAAAPACTVVNNIAFNNAGKGLHVYGESSQCVIANNTVFNNQDGIVIGGAKPGVSLDNAIISNNISYRNMRYGLYESGAIGTHNRYIDNLINGNCIAPGSCNDPRSQVSMITGQLTDTITSDPQFVNYTGTASGDYHLKATSPAIRRGMTIGAAANDFDGIPRISPPDIGAYQSTTAQTPNRNPKTR